MISVAVVGLGSWGKRITTALQSADIPIRVVATVDPDCDSGATHKYVDEVLTRSDIDGVILATPHPLHGEQIAACAGAGKHVFCEMPLPLTRRAASAAVAACEDTSVVLGVGHERRFDPAMAKLHQLVSDGQLGAIIHIDAVVSRYVAIGSEGPTRRPLTPQAPISMASAGFHLIDAFIWMFGRVAQLHAVATRPRSRSASGDVLSVSLRSESGVTGTVSMVSTGPRYERFAIIGSTAWAEARIHQRTSCELTSRLITCRQGGHEVVSQFAPADAVVANLWAFARGVSGDEVYPFSAEQLVHNAAVLEAIAWSAHTGDLVAVDHSVTA